MVRDAQPPVMLAIARGWRKRCPRCGAGGIFARWCELRERCPGCGARLESRGGDTWAFTYIGTAVFTGLFVAVVYLFGMPSGYPARAALVMVVVAAMIASMPRRKSAAVALDYVLRRAAPAEIESETKIRRKEET